MTTSHQGSDPLAYCTGCESRGHKDRDCPHMSAEDEAIARAEAESEAAYYDGLELEAHVDNIFTGADEDEIVEDMETRL